MAATCQDEIKVKTCEGRVFCASLRASRIASDQVQDHPYYLETLRGMVWADSKESKGCKVRPGCKFLRGAEVWHVTEVPRVMGNVASITAVRPVPVQCTNIDIQAVIVREDLDSGQMLEDVVSYHIGVFQDHEGAANLSHDSRQWTKVARIYFLGSLPTLTAATQLRVGGQLWKPVSSHDGNDPTRIPYVIAVNDQWPYAKS